MLIINLLSSHDVGETEIIEVSEKGERQDDFQTYEVQREGHCCNFGQVPWCL